MSSARRLAVFVCLMLMIVIHPVAKNADKYMKNQALVWEQLPMQWNEGAFLGNGLVGMVVYVDSTDNSLTLWLSRPDVTDHRLAPDRKTSLGVKNASVMTDYCRMDIGKMKLFPDATILDGTFTLDIFNGELTGMINTDKGLIKLLAYTPYQSNLNVVEIQTSIPYQWNLQSGLPRSPRIQVFPQLKEELKYEDNPQPIFSENSREGEATHPLTAGGDYATYWKEIALGKKKKAVLIAISNEVPQSGLSLSAAKKEVERILAKGLSDVRKESSDWWRAYYGQGLISIPDKKMENFYNIQLYKLATCSHPNGPAMDVFGTFYKTSQWPGLWWNLNVQLTYMSTLPTNRLNQGVNFQALMDELFLQIVEARKPHSMGDYAWALHTYHSHMLYAGKSSAEIKAKMQPMALAVFDKYRSCLEKRDGVYHLLKTESPEYEGFQVYDNSNYNLAALRWLLQLLIEWNEDSLTQPIEYNHWVDILDNLHPDVIDENGYMIASQKPLAKSHRHYSHLLSFYPFRLQNPDKKDTYEILEKSIDHWLQLEDGKGLAGYSFTGAASLYAFLGNGNKAYNQLYHFLNKPIGISILLPNTLYVESGGKNPVIETPLSAATAIAEMLLQGWGQTIRLFPAIPADWKNCSFDKLRAEGGFVISAQRKDGKLSWVKIEAEGDYPCRIKLNDWKSLVQVDGDKVEYKFWGDGVYEIMIKRGQTVVFSDTPNINYRKELSRSFSIQSQHYYGVKKNQGLVRQMDWNVKANANDYLKLNKQNLLQ